MSLGMELDQWKHKSCVAEFGVGEDRKGKWATLYSIRSDERGKGHATELLRQAKGYYEKQGLKFGGTVALNDTMRGIYERLNIEEYK